MGEDRKIVDTGELQCGQARNRPCSATVGAPRVPESRGNGSLSSSVLSKMDLVLIVTQCP